ncbi:MAG: hypothetical protein ACOVN5_12455 [Aquidulcibacter sp.]
MVSKNPEEDLSFKDSIEMITKIMIDKGFSWVVDQVNLEISNGKLVEEEVVTSGHYDPVAKKMVNKRSRKEKLFRTVPYSEKEQLQMFLNAVNFLISSDLRMRSGIWKMLPKGAPRKIVFQNEKQKLAEATVEESASPGAQTASDELNKIIEGFLVLINKNGEKNAN